MTAPRAVLSTLALALLAAGARSEDAGARGAPGTLEPDQLRPGMKGHAVTVFRGTATERFEIEIIDVMPNYLPKQDAILFTSPDPRLRHSGIVGGMSGSPVYVDGKLVGAIAYGYRFNKDPIGGITPIANMLEVGRLPHRPEILPTARPRAGTRAWTDAALGLGTSPLPPRRRPTEAGSPTTAGLEPLAVPLAIGGLGVHATQILADSFGMVPTRTGGGSTGARDGGNRRWQGGDSVSVVLIDGENSVAPNGTVTWVDGRGDSLLAFGHPMFGQGPANVPFAEARVHTIIPSLERSVKIASAGAIRGTMIQDRQAAISLRTGPQAPMIPVTTVVRAPEGGVSTRTYENRVALGFDLTPNLLRVLLVDAAEEAAQDTADVVVSVEHQIDVETSRGARTVRIHEEAFFAQGMPARAVGNSRGVAVAAIVLDNDFEVGKLRAVRQKVEARYGLEHEELHDLRLGDEVVRAGDVVRVRVGFRDPVGRERWETFPIRIPDDADNEEIVVEVSAGDLVHPYRPLPSSLDQLLDTVEVFYPSRSLVLSVYRPGEGLATEGALLPDLPASVLESLTHRGTNAEPVTFKHAARRVLPTRNLVEGQLRLKTRVAPARGFSQTPAR